MQLVLTPEWKKQLKRLWWLLLYPLAFLLKEIASYHPDLVERFFSNGIYPVLSGGVGTVFGGLPFSFVEFLIYGLIVFLVVFAIICIVKAVRKHLTMVRFVSWLLTILIVGGVGVNAFYWMWGFNYFRYPVAASLQLDVRAREPQDLADLSVMLAFAANTLREQVPEDEDGVFTYENGKGEILLEIPDAYANLGKIYPQFSRAVPPAKPVLASELMSKSGIAGIFIPFTEEANVNMHEPALLLASSAAHETAHFLGVAREDEANFIAYLAAICSENPSVQYSGIMLALIHAGNALNDISPSAYSQLHGLYSEGVKRDLAAYNEYRSRYEGKTEEAVSQMNDRYLKSNNQETGVMSYGRMIDLLLAFYDRVK